MKILMTADPEIPVPPTLYGGIERIVALLLKELRNRGHCVGLIAHADSQVETDFFSPWPNQCLSYRDGHVRNIIHLRSAVRDFNPQVVHSFSRLLYLAGVFGSRIPRIMSYQREPTGRTIRISRWLHRTKLHLTGCSQYIADRGRAVGGGIWNAIPNFVELSQYKFVSKAQNDAPLVFLSRIEPVKGPHLAIEIAKKAGRPLVIAGNYQTTGPHAKYWTENIEPHLGRDGIEYVGTVNDSQKNELLGRCAALLLPIQWNEPFGIVFAESLACGTPVISFPTGAIPEIVVDGIHGYHISDVNSGVQAVKRVLELDRSKCRERIERFFCTKVITDRYEDLYSVAVGS